MSTTVNPKKGTSQLPAKQTYHAAACDNETDFLKSTGMNHPSSAFYTLSNAGGKYFFTVSKFVPPFVFFRRVYERPSPENSSKNLRGAHPSRRFLPFPRTPHVPAFSLPTSGP